MLHVVMTKGLPASGKSTWAKAEVVRSDGSWKRLNKDDLRDLLDCGKWSAAKEKFVLKTRDTLLTLALKQGFNVIIDDTNLDDKHWKDVKKLLSKLDIDVTLREECFLVDVEEAVTRDSKRLKPVGRDVIEGMWKRYVKGKPTALTPRSEVFYAKKHFSALEQDKSLPKAIICDLDGTLALMGDRSPYDASRCDEKDHPNVPVVETVRLFYRAGYRVLFVSGRDEKDRAPTERFIIRCLPELSGAFIHNEIARLKAKFAELPSPDIDAEAMLLLEELAKIPVDQPQAMLLMRKNKDMRSDTVVKREIWDNDVFGKFNVLVAIDDRTSVVATWRHDIGLPCFQVAEGDF